ncbi:MAG: MEDS domain-containing protein [Nitrospirota bacterium]|nr:MEDS domain-containing protein [Nitrospirota bacterium]
MGGEYPAGIRDVQKDRVPLGFGNLYASAGDHIGHFYRTSEEEMSVLVSFLKAGLEAHDKCVCLIGSGSKRQELQEALKADGIDAESAVASGQLVVDEGASHPKELQDMLGKVLAEIPEKFTLLRWVGVMSWALKKIPTSEKLMEWETHCNTVEDPAAIFLCQYELPTFLGTVVMDAMRTHPICIVSGVIHQNPYYEKPEVYLEELRRRASTTLA